MMISCRQAAELASERLDRRISLGERLRLRLHLALCRSCSRYQRQLRFLRRAVHGLARRPSPPEAAQRLPEDARERIRRRLDQG